MTGEEKRLDEVERLVRRHGHPPPPAVDALVTEIRSDGAFVEPEAPEMTLPVLGKLVIEWCFELPWAVVGEFHDFLRDAENYIAESCRELMKGVEYRGTYVELAGERPRYRTVWAYATRNDLSAWEEALVDKQSRFYLTVQRLRAYSIMEKGGSSHWYAPAALWSDLGAPCRGTAFMALTVAAARAFGVAAQPEAQTE